MLGETSQCRLKMDILTKVQMLEDSRKQQLMNRVVGDMSQSQVEKSGALVEFNSSLQSSSKTEVKNDDGEMKAEARRTRFAGNINSIHRKVMSSEVRNSHLLQPPRQELDRILRNL